MSWTQATQEEKDRARILSIGRQFSKFSIQKELPRRRFLVKLCASRRKIAEQFPSDAYYVVHGNSGSCQHLWIWAYFEVTDGPLCAVVSRHLTELELLAFV
jgi:hypothetical protein